MLLLSQLILVIFKLMDLDFLLQIEQHGLTQCDEQHASVWQTNNGRYCNSSNSTARMFMMIQDDTWARVVSESL